MNNVYIMTSGGDTTINNLLRDITGSLFKSDVCLVTTVITTGDPTSLRSSLRRYKVDVRQVISYVMVDEILDDSGVDLIILADWGHDIPNNFGNKYGHAMMELTSTSGETDCAVYATIGDRTVFNMTAKHDGDPDEQVLSMLRRYVPAVIEKYSNR